MHDKADPNTMLRIAVSFILYKAKLKVKNSRDLRRLSLVTILVNV